MITHSSLFERARAEANISFMVFHGGKRRPSFVDTSIE